MSLSVLVADDSAVFRTLVSEVVEGLAGAKVVGVVSSAPQLMARVRTLAPDLVVFDLGATEADRLATLSDLHTHHAGLRVILCTTKERCSSRMQAKALELSVLCIVDKPTARGTEGIRAGLVAELLPKIESCVREKRGGRSASDVPSQPNPGEPLDVRRKVLGASEGAPMDGPTSLRRRVEIVAIAVSTGGPEALGVVIPKLDVPVPVVVAQHMPPSFTEALAQSLRARCQGVVCEGRDGMRLEKGVVYIAPGGRQTRVRASRDGKPASLSVSDEAAPNGLAPSADELFVSVAEVYGGAALGVIMTGMGSDGTLGAKALRERGAQVIAQEESSCVVWGMPRRAIEAKVVDRVVPLSQLAETIRGAVGGDITFAQGTRTMRAGS